MITGPQANINVTPMIDILLVLLITFLLVTPFKSTGLDARIPQQSDRPSQEDPSQIVVSIREDRSVWVNSQPVALDRLADRLRVIYAHRPHGVLFVQGAGSLDFQDVARVIDVAHGAGIEQTALVVRNTAGGL